MIIPFTRPDVRYRVALSLLLIAASPLVALADPAGTLRFRSVPGADDVPLNVVETGDPARPGILFVHGIGQSYLSFEGQLHSSLAKRFHLVAFDLRGHGNSGKPWDRAAYVDPAKWATDVEHVMSATGLDRPVLVGWSYGTLVVADYLRQAGTAHLAGVVLLGGFGGLAPPAPPPPPSPETSAAAAEFRLGREHRDSPDLEANIAACRVTARFLTAKTMPAEWVERATLIGMLLPAAAHHYMFEQPSANRDLVPKLTVPLLLVVGSKDPSSSEVAARALAAEAPSARVTVYPEAGHSVFVEDPERFNRELAEFAVQAFAIPGR